MAHGILLKDASGNLEVTVCPAHGGMVAGIAFCGKQILRMDRHTLEMTPMMAGGMPLMFPFPSKTKNDSYVWEDKQYLMPMHGLVKNAAFAVESVSQDTMKLWIEPSPAWVQQCYPFDFRLEVTYQVAEGCLHTTARIENKSEKPMPHGFGWHPFFLSTDKTRISLDHSMTVHYDYGACQDHPCEGSLDLSTWLDDVFHTSTDHSFRLTNTADGYQVECRFDPQFDVMVVCSFVQDSMCIEPWCGIPDSINQNRFLQWVQPGCTEEYRMDLYFKTI